MSRIESPGPGPVRSFIEGRAFTDRPGPNIPMIVGYTAVAAAVGPDVVEQSADLVCSYMKSMSFGPNPNVSAYYVPKAIAFVAGLSGAALHTRFALLAARRQAVAPPVVNPDTKLPTD